MNTIVTQAGQDIFDTQLQGAGTLDELFSTLRTNDLTMNGATQGDEVVVAHSSRARAQEMLKSGKTLATEIRPSELRVWRAFNLLRKDPLVVPFSITCLRNFVGV